MATLTTFNWSHPADSVQLAGSFNDWKPADMKKDNDGKWTLDLPVNAGSHQFKFVVDGQWVHDKEQECVTNDIGSLNNTIDVEAPAEAPASPAPVPKPAINGTIEVERKFVVPADFASVLPQHGFNLVKEFEETLADDYFDNGEYALIQADHWLRRRNGDWELKYPIVGCYQESTTRYHETSDADDILAKLAAVSEGLDKQWQQDQLTCYAHLETRRWYYRKDAITIVVDVTQWGFRVGEIEIMVEAKDQVPEAAKRIEEIAIDLSKHWIEASSLNALHNWRTS